MSKTISSSISTGVTLSATYDPLLITSTGTIAAGSKSAIYGNSSQSWQIYNSGLLESTNAAAVLLKSASEVVSSGTISNTSEVVPVGWTVPRLG